MTDAADIRRAIERAGLRGFARRSGCPPAAVQRLVKRGAYPERGPHGEAMRAAVAEVLADAGPEPCASPGAGGGPVEERLNELARTAGEIAEALNRADSVRRIPWPAAVARHVATARKLARELADALGEPGA